MSDCKREDKKDRILDAGIKVMYLNGYNGTGVKDIVNAAGIPKGSFYNYFDSKEAFALAALDAMFVDTSSNNFLQSKDLPPLERLTGFFESGAEKAKQGGYLLGCFIGNLTQEMADVSEPIRLKLDLLLCRLTALIEDCLQEAQERGDIPKDRDIKKLAQFIFNAWEGTLLRMKAAKNCNAFDSFLHELPMLLS
ncbi:MAG: TetR family transcriptional regulator [Gammaproteobacteria bacterium]|nr:TetR family transcriptional regulator [Gammaproteobacteria bacterium]